MIGMKRPDEACLARIRQVAGDNVSAFARRLGMPVAMVHAYLSGKSAPSYEFFDRLASLGIDINWILTGTDHLRETRPAVPTHPQSEIFTLTERIAGQLSQLPPADAREASYLCEALVSALKRIRKKDRK